METTNTYRTKNTTCSDWLVFHTKRQEVIYHKLPYLTTTLTTSTNKTKEQLNRIKISQITLPNNDMNNINKTEETTK